MLNSPQLALVTVADVDSEDHVGNSLLQIWELACEDANSKLVEVVTVADVDSEDHVGKSLLPIWELMFGPKTNFFSDFEHKDRS